MGIYKNSEYQIPQAENWNYRTNHPLYNLYSDPSIANKLFTGDKLCVRISFSKPEFNYDDIDFEGNNLSNFPNFLNTSEFADIKVKYENLVSSSDPESVVMIEPEYLNALLDQPITKGIYLPHLLFTTIKINEIDISVELDTII